MPTGSILYEINCKKYIDNQATSIQLDYDFDTDLSTVSFFSAPSEATDAYLSMSIAVVGMENWASLSLTAEDKKLLFLLCHYKKICGMV